VLVGLRGAIDIAAGIGLDDEAASFRREYNALKEALLARLRQVTADNGGYIPPGLDEPGGQDWGNMMAVYPEQVLPPHDPMVTATLDSTRAKYQEGIMTYGDGYWLHDYLTMKNTETEVIRGDQEMALEELYAVLVHTSSTHAGFEYTVRPWGTRDVYHNLTPHGWFAAKYRTLLRNMLVREEGDALHVLSALSPAWLGVGDSLVVRDAPTEFGPVDLRLDVANDTTATLAVASRFTRPPSEVVVHVPWFVDVRGAEVDGRRVTVEGGVLRLAPDARSVRLTWTRRPEAAPLSYERAVEDFKREYRRRWEAWISGRR
jgi:hypothetical protein